MSKPAFKAGLEDVVAANSEICFIDGQTAKLVYRGYDIDDLAAHAIFEEVAYLLWHGSLPNARQLEKLKQDLFDSMHLAPELEQLLRSLPRGAAPMEVLRTAVSAAGLWDTDREDRSPEATLRCSTRLTALTAALITARHRLEHGLEPVAPRQDLNLAGNFLYMLTGSVPDDLSARALDVALILHADHELNASTFAARVTIATLSDIYSAVTSAIGALKGPMHGGANERVMRMLQEIGQVENAERWVKEALAAKRRIPGFGHRVYRTTDPRAHHLRALSRQVAERKGDTRWIDLSEAVERIVTAEKQIYPNVDFYSASLYYSLGIPIELFTPVFALSRMTGWTAHIREQLADNRLIRPRAVYVGPKDLKYVPIDQR